MVSFSSYRYIIDDSQLILYFININEVKLYYPIASSRTICELLSIFIDNSCSSSGRILYYGSTLLFLPIVNYCDLPITIVTYR